MEFTKEAEQQLGEALGRIFPEDTYPLFVKIIRDAILAAPALDAKVRTIASQEIESHGDRSPQTIVHDLAPGLLEMLTQAGAQRPAPPASPEPAREPEPAEVSPEPPAAEATTPKPVTEPTKRTTIKGSAKKQLGALAEFADNQEKSGG